MHNKLLSLKKIDTEQSEKFLISSSIYFRYGLIILCWEHLLCRVINHACKFAIMQIMDQLKLTCFKVINKISSLYYLVLSCTCTSIVKESDTMFDVAMGVLEQHPIKPVTWCAQHRTTLWLWKSRVCSF